MAETEKKKKKTKSKLSKPSFSLARDGYKFVLSFSNIDEDADYIWIEREILEHQDNKNSTKKQRDYEKIKLGAKQNQSWSYTLEEGKYYPFVADGGDNKNKPSDYDQRIDKVKFTVWTTGKVPGKNIQSEKVTKSYEFDKAVKPKVDIGFTSDGTSLDFDIETNDDYSINGARKKVATRTWVWLTKQVKGGKETKVSGYTGKWYNINDEKHIHKQIATAISPTTPEKYIVHAYSAGPGGKSETVEKYHVFAKPLPPKAPKITCPNILPKSNVDNGYGVYDVSWEIDTQKKWHPVDNVTIQYRDQAEYKGASDIYGENMGSWSSARDNIDAAIKKIQTNEIGAPDADTVRYFRILAEHDGNVTPGYVTGVVAYGTPSNVSSPKAEVHSSSGSQTLVFSWSNPPSQLYGTSPSTAMYNGTTLGDGGRLRILIFKGSDADTLIKTIYYGSDEWKNQSWVYTVPRDDLDTGIDYCFQVRVGRDDCNPGARSNLLWLYNIEVPSKCTNVKAKRLGNNTSVELTWDNPTVDDTIRNGIQIAWSNMPNAWESNSAPSTTEFENGAMTKAYITGLSAGEFYYFWVRRYEDTPDGTRNYGIWSDISEGVLLADKPSEPTLTLSRSWVKERGTLSAQWIYYASGNLPQEQAQIEISTNKSKWHVLTTAYGEEDKCDINLNVEVNGVFDENMNLTSVLKYPAGDYFLRVVVKNTMGTATSEPVELKIATNPTCSLSSSSIIDYTFTNEESETSTVKAITDLPINVNVAGDGDLKLFVYCADTQEWEHPDNVENLFEGDCVWTSSVEAGDYTIEKIFLADNGRYRLQLECIDPDTNLAAEPQYLDFEVHWDHQAVAPEDSELTINEDGTATLVPIKPEGADYTDVCDIYRTTVDGRYLCRRDVPWGATVIDRLPTFGSPESNIELAYCFCTRTINGDEAWVDLVYTLGRAGITINFGSEEIKLPWNVSNGDNRTKTGEIRTHLGGSKMYYGQPVIDRSHSLSSVLVKMDDEDVIEKLYELSRYNELCYVRTSNGIGYPATVDVSTNRDYNNQIVSVSIDAKEADSLDEFLGEIESAPEVE